MSNNPNRVILVTGGARSGKSSFAEKRACDAGSSRFYIATCPVLDDETRDRVRRHRERRAADRWTTIEEEVDLEGALERAARAGADAVLVDCLTLWINNLMYRDPELDETAMARRAEALAARLKRIPAVVVLVLNEVGMGIVPDNPESRRFRDLSGRCGQILAASADDVFLLAAGIPLRLK